MSRLGSTSGFDSSANESVVCHGRTEPSLGDAFGYDARGLLVAAQNDDVGLIREYDALGRMRREIDTRFGTGVGYAYDAASRLTAKVYPDGSAVHYAHDGAGRTVGISDPFGDTTRFVYDAAGRRVQKLGTKGLRTEYAYALGTGWLTGVTSFTETGGVAAAFTYPSHDDIGNRLAMTETSGGTTAYSYDALDRLATLDPPDEAIYPANGALTEFAYDAAGNRTDFGPKSGGSFASPHTTYGYNAATKRLLNIKVDGAIVETFGGYDGNGNPATWTPPGSAARTLKYDALGRLVSITGGFSASYVYDPFGRRIEKTEAGVTTRYKYDGLDVVAEYSASQLEATYVFGPGIDEVLKLKRGTTLAAYHSDGLGSVVSITDSSNGASLKTYRYDAFGRAIAQTGTLANAYTYTGREQDVSGLYYYRARYYLPSAGRFLTPDPIGLAGGINAYTYVGSNPVNYTDPFGLMAGRAPEPAGPQIPLFAPDPFFEEGIYSSPIFSSVGGAPNGWETAREFGAPTLIGMPSSQSADRQACVIAGGGCSFSVADNPRARGSAPLYELHSMSQVGLYDYGIDLVSSETGVDPNLIRSVMYVETTHGYYEAPLRWAGIQRTILPMNVHADYWSDLGFSRAQLEDPYYNIKAGALILRGIQANLPPGASIAQIGTLYNNLYAPAVTDYGARVADVYRRRPW